MNEKNDEKNPSKRENDQKVMDNYLQDVMNILIYGRFE